jgi:hypothetical protein
MEVKLLKKSVSSVLAMLSLILCLNRFEYKVFGEEIDKKYIFNMKRDLLVLMMAYPEYVKAVNKEEDKVYLIMKSGKRILYDDRKVKTVLEKENNPDLQDMLEQVYPLNDINDIMPEDFDPGRVRVYELIKEVYGGTEAEIRKNLGFVNLGRRYQFNLNNNAASSLQNAMNDILNCAKNKSNIFGFLYPLGGTFNYRRISGTNRLSPHAYGIAIDLRSDRKDYWKWATREEGKKRLNSYPREIVKYFEDNNFIWGGKWSHFDILHFEYRPELILKAKYFGNRNIDEDKLWYEGVPVEIAEIKIKIETLDRTFN